MPVLRNPQVNAQMGFAPLKLMDIASGRITAKLYLKITSTMAIYERAHAFQVKEATLTNLPMDFNCVFAAFGVQLNASLTVEGLLSNWQCYFKKRWMDFTHLTILSLHKSNSDCINNTTVAGSP